MAIYLKDKDFNYYNAFLSGFHLCERGIRLSIN